MNCNDKNNGPLPTLPQSTTSLEVSSVSEEKPVCRKYVWGTCTKQTQCKFRHELNIDEMKKVLKFCHDHQNRTGCTREDCTYLHTTKEEENLFRAAGQIPRVLAERHAAMAAAVNLTSAETIPQIAMFIESFKTSSQPPPPPPTVTTPTVLSPVVMAPAQVPSGPPPPPPPRPAPTPSATPNHLIQQPPPPPPPPGPTINFSSNNGLKQNYTLSRPPPSLPPGFDASRPPPPLPTAARVLPGSSTHTAPKHKLPELNDAGPNKLRKPDDTNPAEEPCYNCTQAELRIELYKQQAERLQSEDEYQSLIYKKKQEEFQIGKMILKSLVGPEMFRILEDYIEGPQVGINDILEQQNQTSLVSSRNIILDLLECLVGGTARNFVTPNPPLPDPLPSLPRRLSPNTRSSSELVNTVMELFRNSNIGNDRQTLDYRVNDIDDNRISTANSRLNGSSVSVNANLFATPSNVPGYFANTLTANPSATAVTKSNATSVPASNPSVNVTAPPRHEHSITGTSGQNVEGFSVSGSYPVRVPGASLAVAGPSGLNNATLATSSFRGPTTVPPFLPTFHPSVPPPINRPHYQTFPSNINSTQNALNRLPGPLQQPPPIRPPPGAQPPSNYSSNMMVRYPPHPSFYPPYQ